jgi:glucokinase
MVTLLAPERVVVGGGVSKISEKLFWDPLRDHFSKYSFGPLRDSKILVPAALGDDVVLFGAAAIASTSDA